MIRLHLYFGALLLLGCGSSAPELKTADHYFEQGMAALDKKRCLKAMEEFQRVVTNFPGSSRVPDAQYYLAEAHYCSKDYLQAVFEYERLLNTYPSSQWADEAQFQIAEAYYKQLRRAELDQTETAQALSNYRRFIDEHPDSDLIDKARERIIDCRSRLAKKRFLGARLYQRQKHYDAAIITYKDLIRDFPETPYFAEALARLGEIALAQGNPNEARTYWREAVQATEDPKLQKRVEEKLTELDAAPEK